MRSRSVCCSEVVPFLVMAFVQCSQVALSTLFKKASRDGISYLIFILYSYAIAGLLLLPFALFFERSKKLPPVDKVVVGRFILLGFLGYATQLLGFKGIEYSSPTMASSMSSLTPAVTFVLAILFRMEKVKIGSLSSRAKIAGTLISIAGALVVVLYQGPAVTAGRSPGLSRSSAHSNWVTGGLLLIADYILFPLWYIVQMSNAGQPHDDGRSIRRRGISASARLAMGRLIEEEQAPSPQEHDVASEQPYARRDHVFDPMPTWDGPELNILASGRMNAICDGDGWQDMYDLAVGDQGPVRSPRDAEGRQGRNTCHVPPSGQPGTSVTVEVEIERYAGGGARHTVRNRAGRFAQSFGGSCNVGEPDIGRAPRNRRKRQTDDTWLVRGPMGGGPQNDLVIPSFGGHVAVDVWNGIERGVLRCHARSTLCKQLVTTLPDLSDVAHARIRATGLAHLPAIMFQFLEMALISAFVERWQPDTNTFHMPFGEMTILMHDVEMILAIPTIGGPVASTVPVETVQEASAELFGKDVESFVAEDWNGGNINGQALMARCVATGQSDNFQVRCYMLTLFSSTLFVDKTGTKVRANLLPLLDSQLSWGSATLASLYLQLGIASRPKARGLSGCCTLLHAWIYEYFPMFRPRLSTLPALPGCANRWHTGDKMGRDIQRLATIRRQLDALQADQVDWLPYGLDVVRAPRGRTHYRGVIRYLEAMEAYMPDRVVRQFGLVQGIPWIIRIVPEPCTRPADPAGYSVTYAGMMQLTLWQMGHAWHDGQLAEFPLATSPSECTLDYEEWYASHSHPLIANPEHDATSDRPDKAHLESLMLSDMMSDLDPFDSSTVDGLVDPCMKELLTTWISCRDEYRRVNGYEPIP